MIQEIFVDGVLGAGFSGGALRLDFFSHSPEKKGEKTPRVRLILTPEGFTGCCKAMEDLLAKLVQAGVVRPAPDQTVRPGQAGGATPNAQASGGGPDAQARTADQAIPTGRTQGAADAPADNTGEPNPSAPVGDRGVSPNF